MAPAPFARFRFDRASPTPLQRQLYDRIRVMAAHFDGVRRGLDGATEAYNRAVGSLESRVLVTARRFRELGSGVREEIPVLDVVGRAARAMQSPDLEPAPRELPFATDALVLPLPDDEPPLTSPASSRHN